MNKVYDYVTERIIKELEKGNIPWQKPWSGSPAINYVTRKPYQGINTLLLSKSGEYLTWHQIQQLGGKIKKGAKAEFVVFYKTYTKTEKTINEETGEEITKTTIIPVLRYYNVFHIDDVEGIPSKIQTFQHDPITEIEAVINKYKDKPKIIHDDSTKAYYSPMHDYINIPDKKYFKDIEKYYSTLFHEAVHSTGHYSRLNRFKKDEQLAAFGSKSYSKEELIAEIGAAMLCNHCGILPKTLENTGAYIKSWIKVLKNDKRFIIQASSKAQKAVDYILGAV
jgi:antirestriction protein ArdC